MKLIIVSLISLLLFSGTAQLETQLDEIERAVEAGRGITPSDPIERVYLPTAEWSLYVDDLINAHYDAETYAAEVGFLYTFGFTDQVLPIERPRNPVYAFDFYNPDTQQIIVVNEGLTLLRSMQYAFVYAQALLDHEFSTGELLATAENPDQALAYRALVNGDAYYAMQLYMESQLQRDPTLATTLLRSAITAPTILNTASTWETEGNYFTFESGANFVSLMRSREMDIYTDPPISTEQVLHPEKYLSHEQPHEVEITPLEPADDYNLILDRPMGEFGLQQHLHTQLNASMSELIAAGWGGDHFQLYQRHQDYILIWRLTWDTALDAAEFNENYNRWLELRLGAVPALVETNQQCWQAVYAACLVIGENESLVVYAPDVAAAQAIIEAQPGLE